MSQWNAMINVEMPECFPATPNGEGDPDILGYFKEEQRGLRVSAWISVMGRILGPEELIALLSKHGKVVSQRKIRTESIELLKGFN